MTDAVELWARLEAHAAAAWPATIAEPTPDGWLLRATPTLDRGRSNNALSPCRPLGAAEIAPAIDVVEAFARRHGIRAGVQVSPLELHDPLDAALARRGWEAAWDTVVMTAPAERLAHAAPRLVVEDAADPVWLEVWARAEGRTDVDAHAATVYAALAGRALFGRLGEEAAGLVVVADGLAGLFSLAVAPAHRRRGLGGTLVRGLVAAASAPLAYLQVEERNTAALGLYTRLGLRPAYRYRHRRVPTRRRRRGEPRR